MRTQHISRNTNTPHHTNVHINLKRGTVLSANACGTIVSLRCSFFFHLLRHSACKAFHIFSALLVSHALRKMREGMCVLCCVVTRSVMLPAWFVHLCASWVCIFYSHGARTREHCGRALESRETAQTRLSVHLQCSEKSGCVWLIIYVCVYVKVLACVRTTIRAEHAICSHVYSAARTRWPPGCCAVGLAPIKTLRPGSALRQYTISSSTSTS